MLSKTAFFDFTSAQYLFESIGNIAYYYLKSKSNHRAKLETIIIDFFKVALKDKSDLINFCLQVMAIFLQL